MAKINGSRPAPTPAVDRALDPKRSVGSGSSMAPLPIATAKPKFGGDPGFSKTMPGPNPDPGILKTYPGRNVDPGFGVKTIPTPKSSPKTTTKKVG
jgi:hypothetical protein